MTKQIFIRIQADEHEKHQIMWDLKSVIDTGRYELVITFEQFRKVVPPLTV